MIKNITKLETVIQSEVIQKEKSKYCILTYIYMGSRRVVQMDLFARQQWRHRLRGWTCGYIRRKEWDELKA